MIALYAFIYSVVLIATFCCLIYDDKKQGHDVSAGVLFFYTILAIIWPFTWFILITMTAYQWLANWVNK